MRVGVLLDSRVAAWHEHAIERVCDLEGVAVTYAVVDASRGDDSTMQAGADAINRDGLVSLADLELFYDVLSEDGLKAILYADQKLGWHCFGETERRKWLRSKPASELDCLAAAAVETCRPHSDGTWKTLPDDVVSRIERRCDVVLRFGFGLLEGEVLTAPEHGVLSVHGSDIRKYRGMGAKLSFLNDDETVTVTLQQLTEEIDGGAIVTTKSERVPEGATLDKIGGTIYRLSTEAYAEGVRRLRDGATPWQPDTLGEYYSHDLQRKSPRFVGSIVLKNNYYRMKSLLST